MRQQLLNSIQPVALALLGILGLTSCIEESTVVKVNKDGTGIIHIRKYENSLSGKGLLGGGGDNDQKVNAPTEEELRAKAKAMGKGVTFKSIRTGRNKSGWAGYELVFSFEDINSVKLDLNSKKESGSGEGGQLAVESKEAESDLVTFEMKDGLLSIRTPDPKMERNGGNEGKVKEPAEGASDPFGEEPANEPMMAAMAAMFSGAKLGFFVEVDGEIAESNAKYRKDNMITLMKVDLGKVLANPEAIHKMQAVEGGDRREVQVALDSIEGIDVDLQEPINVKLK